MIAEVVLLLRRLVAIPVFLAVAVIAQVSVVNRLPLPGGGTPNLVLLTVASLAVVGGPVPGMLAGFLSGLALDVAPPGSILVGQYALVFCLAGYLCGAVSMRIRQGIPKSAPDPGMLGRLPVVAVGTAAAEALLAGLGRLVSDPRVTVPAIEHVLPATIVYDLLLSPFVLGAVLALRGAPEPGSVAAAPIMLAVPKAPVTGHAVVRGAGFGGLVMASGKAAAVPRLRFTGQSPDGLRAQARTPSRPEPKLRFASSSSPSTYRTTRPLGTATPSATRLRAGAFGAGAGGGTAFRNGAHGGAAFRDAGARTTRGSELFGGGARGGTGPRGSAFSNGSAGGSAFRGTGGTGRRLPVSLLNGNAPRIDFSGGLGSAFRGTGGTGRRLPVSLLNGSTPRIDFSGALGPSLFGGTGLRGSGLGSLRPGAQRLGRHWIRAGGASPAFRRAMQGGEGQAGRLGPIRSANGHMRGGWLKAATPDTAPTRSTVSPRKGWLRPAKPAPAVRRRTPGRGWLRPAKPVTPARRHTPSRGWLSRKPARITWQRKSPRGGWLRQKRSRLGGSVLGGGRQGLGAPRTRMGGRR